MREAFLILQYLFKPALLYMKQKLNCILLIDDDESTNYLHRRIINKMNCTQLLEVAEDGTMALNYLSQTPQPKVTPDLIFLDINMPIMNGWEFLQEYCTLQVKQPVKPVMVMLTTSLNHDDEVKAGTLPEINEFRNKPLTREMVAEIIAKYFPERV